jgi:hypothetical protein
MIPSVEESENPNDSLPESAGPDSTRGIYRRPNYIPPQASNLLIPIRD